MTHMPGWAAGSMPENDYLFRGIHPLIFGFCYMRPHLIEKIINLCSSPLVLLTGN